MATPLGVRTLIKEMKKTVFDFETLTDSFIDYMTIVYSSNLVEFVAYDSNEIEVRLFHYKFY